MVILLHWLLLSATVFIYLQVVCLSVCQWLLERFNHAKTTQLATGSFNFTSWQIKAQKAKKRIVVCCHKMFPYLIHLWWPPQGKVNHTWKHVSLKPWTFGRLGGVHQLALTVFPQIYKANISGWPAKQPLMAHFLNENATLVLTPRPTSDVEPARPVFFPS